MASTTVVCAGQVVQHRRRNSGSSATKHHHQDPHGRQPHSQQQQQQHVVEVETTDLRQLAVIPTPDGKESPATTYKRHYAGMATKYERAFVSLRDCSCVASM